MLSRTGLLAVGLLTLVALSGCAATQDNLRFASEPGSFGSDALSETEYEEEASREIVRNRTVEAGGTTRNVTVVNQLTVYTRSATVEPLGERQLAAAAVFTTPSITIVGSEFNPIADATPKRLVSTATNVANEQLPGDRIRDVQKVETRQRQVLDTETNVTVFSATTTVDGVSVDVFVHVAKVKHEGDYVVVAAAYPQRIDDTERDKVSTLLDSVVHEGDE
jgi:hypothetical protein